MALEEQLNQTTQTPVGPQDTFCEKCDIKAKQIDKLENKLQIITTKLQDIETNYQYKLKEVNDEAMNKLSGIYEWTSYKLGIKYLQPMINLLMS